MYSRRRGDKITPLSQNIDPCNNASPFKSTDRYHHSRNIYLFLRSEQSKPVFLILHFSYAG